MSAPRQLALHRALVRPELLLGCDRRLLYLLGCVASVFMGPAGFARNRWDMVIVGVLVFAVFFRGLQLLAKRDPFWWDIRLRARAYAAGYVARARWDVKRKGPR